MTVTSTHTHPNLPLTAFRLLRQDLWFMDSSHKNTDSNSMLKVLKQVVDFIQEKQISKERVQHIKMI